MYKKNVSHHKLRVWNSPTWIFNTSFYDHSFTIGFTQWLAYKLSRLPRILATWRIFFSLSSLCSVVESLGYIVICTSVVNCDFRGNMPSKPYEECLCTGWTRRIQLGLRTLQPKGRDPVVPLKTTTGTLDNRPHSNSLILHPKFSGI